MPGNGSRVSRDDALDPLVLALDVGSTASRGDVYDAAGRPVQGGRRKVPHAFRTSADGASEIDPDQVVDELGQIITGRPSSHCRAVSPAWHSTRSPPR
jgi:gluconokinase